MNTSSRKRGALCIIVALGLVALAGTTTLAVEEQSSTDDVGPALIFELDDPVEPARPIFTEPRTARAENKETGRDGRASAPPRGHLDSQVQRSPAKPPQALLPPRPGATMPNLLAPRGVQAERGKPLEPVQQSDSSKQNTPLHDRLGIQLAQQGDRLVIREVAAGGAFDKAGLRAGDAIISVMGQSVRGLNDFNERIFGSTSDKTIEIKVLRSGRDQIVHVSPADYLIVYPTTNRAALGVNVDRRYTDRVILSNVTPGGPADRIGLQIGDTILRVGDRKVRSPKELIEAIGRYKPGDKVEVEVRRVDKTDIAIAELVAASGGPSRAMNVEQPPSGDLQPATDAELEPAANPFGAERIGQRTGEGTRQVPPSRK